MTVVTNMHKNFICHNIFHSHVSLMHTISSKVLPSSVHIAILDLSRGVRY